MWHFKRSTSDESFDSYLQTIALSKSEEVVFDWKLVISMIMLVAYEQLTCDKM